MRSDVEISLRRQRFSPGERIQGVVRVHVDHVPKRKFRIALRFLEKSVDSAESAVWETGIEPSQDLTPGAAIPFDFELPPAARPGFTARSGDLWWEVTVLERGWRRRPLAAQPIEVVPAR